jgi:hypothetical protein
MAIPSMLIPMGIKAGLGALQAFGHSRELDPYAEAYQDAMGRAQGYINDPYRMYREDPTLLDQRRMAMDTVQSRQLARTGGTLGGNYARQLMREGAAIDRANLDAAVKRQTGLARMYGPAAMSQASMGGPMGIAGGIGQGMMSDYMFNQFLGGLGGGDLSTVGITNTGGVPMVSQDASFNPVPMWK